MTASSDMPGVSLDIAITSPFVWPWVRRGSERMLHDLSRYLVGRGHRVTVFSTGPEDDVERRDGVAYHLFRQRFGTRFRQFNCCHDFALRLGPALAGIDPDIVFSMNYFDAYAAVRARQRSGARYRVVFHSAGILTRRHFRAVPLDAWFFRAVHRWADLTFVVSHAAGTVYRREFGIDPVVLYPPIVVEDFSPKADAGAPPPSADPRIVFSGDADDRRKGARALCRAFPLVKERYPRARLLFAGRASEATRQALLAEAAQSETADDVTFLGLGKVEDLPALYQGASVTVLPSVAEAFGIVLAESLAAGTPVVGTRHGGITEIIDGELVGRLFDPGSHHRQTDNFRGLAEAIVAVLDRGKTPEVVAACRAQAQRYSWAVLGPQYERVLLQLASRGGDAPGA
jgi:phosphatidylinositol alpha-mannosyltransferase